MTRPDFIRLPPEKGLEQAAAAATSNPPFIRPPPPLSTVCRPWKTRHHLINRAELNTGPAKKVFPR